VSITRVTAQVAHNSSAAGGTLLSTSLTAIASRALVVAWASYDTAGGGSARVEDDLGRGATFVLRTTAGGFNQAVEIHFFCNYPGGSRTFSLINSASNTNRTIVVAERAGADLNTPLDGSASASGTSATPASGNVVPAPALDGGYVAGITASANIPSAAAPFADVWQDSTSFTDSEDYLQAVAAAIGATWTQVSGAWEAIAASFKPAQLSGSAFDSTAFDGATPAFDAPSATTPVSSASTSATESLSSLAPTSIAATEALAGLSKTAFASTESLTPVTSAVSTAAYEAQLGLLKTAQAATESLASAARTSASPYTSIGGISAASSVPWESIASLTQTSQSAIENQLSIATNAIAAYEQLASATQACLSAWESLASATKALVSAWESLLGVTQSSSEAWQSTGIPLFPVSQNASSSYEALARAVQLSSSSFESLVPLNASSSSSTERLVSVLRALAGAYEALAGVTRSTDSVIEWIVPVASQLSTSDFESLVSALSQAQASEYEILRSTVALATTATEILGYIAKASTSSYESRGAKIEPPPYDVAIDENVLDVLIEPDAANALSWASTALTIDESFDLDAELSEV
jgi:hypothetical protein